MVSKPHSGQSLNRIAESGCFRARASRPRDLVAIAGSPETELNNKDPRQGGNKKSATGAIQPANTWRRARANQTRHLVPVPRHEMPLRNPLSQTEGLEMSIPRTELRLGDRNYQHISSDRYTSDFGALGTAQASFVVAVCKHKGKRCVFAHWAMNSPPPFSCPGIPNPPRS